MTSQCVIPTVDCVDVVSVDATTAHRVAGRIGAVECTAIASPLSAELAVVSAAPALVTVLSKRNNKFVSVRMSECIRTTGHFGV